MLIHCEQYSVTGLKVPGTSLPDSPVFRSGVSSILHFGWCESAWHLSITEFFHHGANESYS